MVKNKDKIKEILIIILIFLMSGVIFFYQTKKQGFHEDEVYTIISSINPYDGLISAYREKDLNTIMCEKYVFDDNIFKEITKAINFILNKSDYQAEMDEMYNKEVPIWKTKEDVKKFVTLSKENYLNFKSIYYNQTKDNHPPVFYALVHISTILFLGKFTKYSVFLVNIIAFIASCFIIKKILKLINKENIIVPVLIFYGLTMGTISMVIYQRMYMLLTMFILLYFYYSLKIYKSNFELNRKTITILGVITILGFLTQYFFAIYAVLIFLLMIIQMIRRKKYRQVVKYTCIHILYAILGILIFVPSVYHLLSTDRGISNLENTEYFKHLYEYIKYLLYAFTIKDNKILTISIFSAFLIGLIYLLKKSKEKFIILLTIIPSIIYFFIAVKLTTFRELRYITPMIPFLVITLFLIIDNIFKFKYRNIIMTIIAVILVINRICFL